MIRAPFPMAIVGDGQIQGEREMLGGWIKVGLGECWSALGAGAAGGGGRRP
jgi:hypothetical protein